MTHPLPWEGCSAEPSVVHRWSSSARHLTENALGKSHVANARGFWAPQLPAPTVAAASLQAALGGYLLGEEVFCIFLSKFPPAERQHPHCSWDTFPGLLWNARGAREFLSFSAAAPCTQLLGVLRGQQWGFPCSSPSNVHPCLQKPSRITRTLKI